MRKNQRNAARSWTSAQAIFVTGAAMLLTGCTGGVDSNNNDAAVAASPPASSGQTGQTPPDQSATASQGQSIPDGPLDEFRAQIFGTSWQDATEPQAALELLNQQLREEDEFLAMCMREQGFTYNPSAAVEIVGFPNPGAIAYGSREWAQVWGFGISTNAPESRPNGFMREAVDAEMFRGMSDAEFEAWHLAMYGISLVSVTRNATTGGRLSMSRIWLDPESLSAVPTAELGCDIRWSQVSRTRTTPEPFEAIRDEVNRFDGIVALDPRTLTLNASWASCMIDVGEPGWGNPTQLQNGLRALYEEDQIPVEVFLAWDWAAAPDGPPEPSGRAELREREIAAALADWDCRDQLDYDGVLRAIDLDLQQTFVAQHRPELETWVAYLEQQRSGS